MVVALMVSCLYEIALKRTSLEAYLLGDYRVDLISMNKEGLFSLIGCTALFLASCWVGENARHVRDIQSYKQFIKKMAVASVISTSAYVVGRHFLGLESSRRLVLTRFRHFFYCLGQSWVQPLGVWFLYSTHDCIPSGRPAPSSPTSIQHYLRGGESESAGFVPVGQPSDGSCQYDLADSAVGREGNLPDTHRILCGFVLCGLLLTEAEHYNKVQVKALLIISTFLHTQARIYFASAGGLGKTRMGLE